MSKRKPAYPSIKEVQRRVANISIGASTLRNQGGKGMQKEAIRFLSRLKLDTLGEMSKEQFPKWLNEKTRYLMKRFNTKCNVENNWGAARKTINIFLENAFYDRFLAKKYGLERLEDILEIPLDSNVVGKLFGDLEQFNDFTIKGLKRRESRGIQDLAKKRAESIHTFRIYLDLKYWRAKK